MDEIEYFACLNVTMQVSNIRNSLAHLKLNNKLHLDDVTFEAHWKAITDLINCIQGLGKAYFTKQTAKGLCDKLAKVIIQSDV